jgi:hypothetical protein
LIFYYPNESCHCSRVPQKKANIPHNLGTNTKADNDDNEGTISAQNTNKTDVKLCALEGCSNLANADIMCLET